MNRAALTTWEKKRLLDTQLEFWSPALVLRMVVSLLPFQRPLYPSHRSCINPSSTKEL